MVSSALRLPSWLAFIFIAWFSNPITRVACDVLDDYKRVNALVRHIEPSKFDATIKEDAHLVFFGSNFCGHCQALTPTWYEAQKRSDDLKNSFHLEKVECVGRAENEDLCADQKITSYPTVKLFFNGSFREEYNGERDIASLNAYIDNQTEKLLVKGGPIPAAKAAVEKVEKVVKGAADTVSQKIVEALPSSEAKPAALMKDTATAAAALAETVKSAMAELTELAEAGTKPRDDINPDGRQVILTTETFTLLTNNTPWFVMFHAPWCGHCKKLKPVFEELAPSLRGLVNIGAVDCTTEGRICKEHGVRGYPTVKFLLQPHVEIEFKGARTFEGLREFATRFSSKPAFTAVTSAQIPSILEQNEVTFFLVYDPRSSDKHLLTTFQSIAGSLRNDAAFYVTPDQDARSILKAPSTGPAILALRDNGHTTITYTGATADAPAALSDIGRFVSAHRHPRVVHLDSDNQEEILGGDRLVVIAVVDPAKRNARLTMSSILKVLREAAVMWDDKEQLEKLRNLAVFTWLDGQKWSAYVERVYGLYPGNLPTLIVADPKEDKYYDTDNGGRAIAFEPAALVQTINEILDGVAAPKYTSGYLARGVQSAGKSAKAFMAFIQYNLVFLLCVCVIIGLGYMYGGVPGLRRTRGGPKAE